MTKSDACILRLPRSVALIVKPTNSPQHPEHRLADERSLAFIYAVLSENLLAHTSHDPTHNVIALSGPLLRFVFNTLFSPNVSLSLLSCRLMTLVSALFPSFWSCYHARSIMIMQMRPPIPKNLGVVVAMLVSSGCAQPLNKSPMTRPAHKNARCLKRGRHYPNQNHQRPPLMVLL
jgi:hypothetical protein